MDNTPRAKVYDKYADMSALRSDEFEDVRAYTEAYASKFEGKAWEGILYGYTVHTNGKTHRIYMPSTPGVVESRNVTFLETPRSNLPPT